MTNNSLFNAIDELQAYRDRYTTTENGALTLASTGSKVLDFFSRAGSMRKEVLESIEATKGRKAKRKISNISFESQLINTELYKLFSNAYLEDAKLTLLTLFNLRDVRGGKGERSLFRILFKELINKDIKLARKVVNYIPFYGRWDDLVYITKGTELYPEVLRLIKEQLELDLELIATSDKASISLLGKWLPSETSGKAAKILAIDIRNYLGFTSKQYRQMLSALRKHIDIIERYMSSNQWELIDYSHVPSRAAFMYRNVFLEKDKTRYEQFLTAVEKGESSIKATTLYPYEIVSQILRKAGTVYTRYTNTSRDRTLEQLWEALPDYIGEHCNNAIAVVDTSSSMYSGYHMNGKNEIVPIHVSVALGMYLAERNKSEVWKNKFITFDTFPKLQTIRGNNITEKVINLYHADWGGSTNLQAVFDLILSTAKNYKLTQADLPEIVYIISDMEFNSACKSNSNTNLDEISYQFTRAGYIRPRIAFWNVNTKSQQSPASYNDRGVALFSGLSPTVFTAMFGNKSTPYDVMLNMLISERYLPLIKELD